MGPHRLRDPLRLSPASSSSSARFERFCRSAGTHGSVAHKRRCAHWHGSVDSACSCVVTGARWVHISVSSRAGTANSYIPGAGAGAVRLKGSTAPCGHPRWAGFQLLPDSPVRFGGPSQKGGFDWMGSLLRTRATIGATFCTRQRQAAGGSAPNGTASALVLEVTVR